MFIFDCRGPCRLSDGGHHHMNLAVEGYHRNGDSPMSGGQDYVGESDSESNPPQDGEDCGDENPEDEGNVSGDKSHVISLTAFELTHCKLL